MRGAGWRGPGWRSLAVFWAVILLVVVVGGATLQWLGPPSEAVAVPTAVETRPEPPPIIPDAQAVVQPPPAPDVGPTPPGRTTAGPIDDPDPALLEPAKAGNGAMLPRIDGTGRAPMQAYARGFDRTTLRPRIGLILAGVGVNDAGGPDAIRALPGGVTLAIAANAPAAARLLEAARIAGHEYLLALPMDPAADHALLSGATPAQIADRLDWVLSRFAGYAGVTDGPEAARGGLSPGAEPMATVLRSLAARGLFYVESRPTAVLPPLPGLWAVNVDLLVDETAVRSEIDAKLAQLETLSRKRGWALGLAATPRQVTIDRITDWANGLAAKGLVLAPASALVRQVAPATVTGASK
jgi:polysaccharide deacetylase 2 family uncharacterized protein YibQ